jgi:MoxR-like ATPase
MAKHNFGQVFADNWANYKREVKKIIVGLDDVIDLNGICIFSDGHALLEDIPGAGKTTLALALSAAMKDGVGGVFQGTADLLPMDIIGSKAWNPETRQLEIQHGAVTPKMNILVADETNRLAPKTASSLLMVMQERKLNIQGHIFNCADPFLVIGTQNPIEQEGVYPLPEALLDRFAMKIIPGELAFDDEVDLVRRPATFARDQARSAGVQPVLSTDDMKRMRHYAQTEILMELPVSQYAIRLARATRKRCDEHKYMNPQDQGFLDMGAGRRAGIWMTACAKSHAAMRGSEKVHFEDVQAVAPYVLAHRLTLKADQKFGGDKDLPQQIVKRLLDSVPTVA